MSVCDRFREAYGYAVALVYLRALSILAAHLRTVRSAREGGQS